MIFPQLSIFQNILFLLACFGVILLIVYMILLYSGFIRNKRNITSDDIDSDTENYTEPDKFFFNAFTIKGSIFCLAIIASLSFFLSLFIPMWASILIASIMAILLVLTMNFFDREPLAIEGEFGVVSEKIPAKNEGMGKIIVENGGAEMDAESNGGSIKKGKRVIILQTIGNKVIVKKYKKVYR